MSKSAMPVSKAKTAYGLLSEIKKLILARPELYDQEGVRRKSTCGSVCCVGGWVTVLKAPRTHYNNTLSKAQRILGVNNFQARELFDGGAAGYRDYAAPQEHAQYGAQHIAQFQKQYAAQLKAKRV